MFDLSTLQITYFIAAAFLIGFSKTSVGGVGILAVLLAALAFPGKASPGIILPMLIMADILAVVYYRRDCDWKILLGLLPMTIVGVIVGYFAVDWVPVAIFEKILGLIILVMFLISLVLEFRKVQADGGAVATGIVGVLAGASSMIANAAGPVFGIYLLQKGLTKQAFIGTRSWFFLVMNLFKVPFSFGLGLITTQSLTINLYSIPVIVAGAILGVMFVNRINLNVFKWLIRAAVLIAVVRLLAG